MSAKFILTAAIAATLGFAFAPTAVRAADHADSPTTGPDQGADIADVYTFLDPTNNNNVIIIGTFRGFIVPGENVNFTVFDPGVRYRFSIENTGDSKPDKFIDVTFSKRSVVAPDTSPSQTATIAVTGLKGTFTAPVTKSGNDTNPIAPAITEDLTNAKNESTGIRFFAGLRDDPFFFDIPGFNRFVKKALAGDNTAAGELGRGRDTFSGYNVLSICLSVPKTLLLAAPKKNFTPPTKIGVNFSTARKTESVSKGEKKSSGAVVQVDRMGIPGINVVFIPFNSKNAYNAGTPVDDGNGKFYDLIVGTLTALGTTTNAEITGALAGIVGLPPSPPPLKAKDPHGTGDYLRLQTDSMVAPNTGSGGGTGANGFPNGRRLRDDVIDIVIDLVTKHGIMTGDGVPKNDVDFLDAFPFLAPPQQPREGAGNVEDNTRN